MKNCLVKMTNVELLYNLHFDRSTTLKDAFMNLIPGRNTVVPKSTQLAALSCVNLEIREGERIGVLGLNGAGKSTLLKVLARILVPTSGKIEVTGSVQPLIELGAGFNLEFSGRENIYLNGAMLGFSRRDLHEREEEIVSFSELGDFIDVPVKYYSSGMITRLAFTIATSVHPEILLLDEMLSAGDIRFLDKANARINRLLDQSQILVLVSHDLALVERLARRVLILDKGQICFDGPVNQGIQAYRELTASGN